MPIYRLLLAALLSLLATVAIVHARIVPTAARGAASAASRADGPVPAKPRYAVVVVLDGTPAADLHLVPEPHIQDLMRTGVTYTGAFVGQELANTPPGHATIGTGMLPKHHGVMGFLWEDPRTHEVFNPTESWNVIAGKLEQVITNHHVPSLAGRIHARFPGSKVVSVAAHKCYASDAMGTASADDILCALIYHNRWVAQAIGNHRPPPGAVNNPKWDVPIPPRTAGFGPAVLQWRMGTEDSWTTRYALWAFHRIHYPRVLMINLSETDVLGHFAPGPYVMRFLMRQADHLIGNMMTAYRDAGIFNQTEWVITADHGMDHINTFMPFSMVKNAIAEAGATPVYVEHDTAASIGLLQENKAQQVARNLFRLGGRYVDATYYKVHTHRRWMYRQAAAQPYLPPSVSAAYLSLANTMATDSGPDVYAVYAPHISDRNFAAFGYQWRAGHLGPQWADQHIPFVISGPGIRHGVVSRYPARLVDIAPTLEYLLGANWHGTDGVVLENALQYSNAALRSVQLTRKRQLAPVVSAIKRRWAMQ